MMALAITSILLLHLATAVAAGPSSGSRAVPGIDPKALDITIPGFNHTEGTNVTPMVFRVSNNGDVNATATVLRVEYRPSGGGATTTIAVRDLAAENVSLNYTQFPVTWTLWWDLGTMGVAPGAYDLIGRAVQAGDVDPANDAVTLQVNVTPAPRPHVTIPAVTLPPLWYVDDPAFTIGVDVENRGTAPLTWPAVAIIEVANASGGPVLASDTVSNLTQGAPGNTTHRDIVVPVASFPDASTTTFVVRVQGGTDLVNQTRNAGPVQFFRRRVDLNVTFIGLNPASPVAGNAVTVSATIRNDGTKDAVAAPVQFLSSRGPIGNATVNVSEGGATGTAQIVWLSSDADAGSQLITVIAGSSTRTRSVTVSKTPVPNLYIAGIQVSTVRRLIEPGQTQTIFVNVTVANNGTLGVTNVSLVLTLDGVEAGRNDSVSLARGGQVVAGFGLTVTTAENDTTLALVASVAPGADPDKGSVTQTVKVPGDSDTPLPRVVSLQLAPATQERTRNVTLTVTIGNTGDGDAQDVPVDLLDLAPNGDTTTIQTLLVTVPAGGTVTRGTNYTLRSTTPLAEHTIQARIRGPPLSTANATLTVEELRRPVLKLTFEKELRESEAPDGRSKTFKVVLHIKNTGDAATGPLNITLVDVVHRTVVGNSTLANLLPGQTVDVTFTITVEAGYQKRYLAQAITVEEFGGEPVSGVTERRMTAKVKVVPGFEAALLLAGVAVALLIADGRRRRRVRD